MARVELVYDTDCPNIQRARRSLLQGFSLAGLQPAWTEWDRKSPGSPAYVRNYGSPTILIDGRDVTGVAPGPGESSCRLYLNRAGSFDAAPAAEQIAEALRADNSIPPIAARSPPAWHGSLATVPAIVFAFLPKLACPACWPAYAGLLSSVGLGFLLNTAYLLPLTAVFLILAIVALAFRARGRRGYGPFVLGLAAAAAVLAGKFLFDSNAATYAGVGVLIAATVWNAWPRGTNNIGSGPRCARQEPSIDARYPR
jgi:hypothetical protein